MLRPLLATLLLAAAPALAQTPAIDPRLVQPSIAALEALLVLREAEIRVLTENAQKREAEWAEYSAPLWRFGAKN